MATTVAGASGVPPAAGAPDAPMIVPSIEERKTIDFTADSVKTKGPSFEAKIMAAKKDVPQFGFLQPSHPYHVYYRQRILHGDALVLPDSATAATASAAAESAEPPAAAEPVAPAKPPTLYERLMASVHRAALPDLPSAPPAAAAAASAAVAESAALPAPPVLPSRFAVRHPPTAPAVDLDIVKLTALTVARNGRRFLAALADAARRRAHGRAPGPGEGTEADWWPLPPAAFDFLQPTHPNFVYFQALVESYKSVLVPPAGTAGQIATTLADLERAHEALGLGGADLVALLRRHAHRARALKAAAAAGAAEEEAEAVRMLQVDWHDFAVVETVHFAPEEDAYLPEPQQGIDAIVRALSLRAAAARDAAEAAAEAEAERQAALAAEMGVATDAADAAAAAAGAGAAAAALDAVTGAMRGEEAPAAVLTAAAAAAATAAAAAAVAAVAPSTTAAVLAAAQTQVCPICKTLVPTAQLQEHMRIELLDPRWREQKQAIEARKADSSLATGEAIAAALAKGSQQRKAGAAPAPAAAVSAPAEAAAAAVAASLASATGLPINVTKSAVPLAAAGAIAGPALGPGVSTASASTAATAGTAGTAGAVPVTAAAAQGFAPPLPGGVGSVAAAIAGGAEALSQAMKRARTADAISQQTAANTAAAAAEVSLPPLPHGLGPAIVSGPVIGAPANYVSGSMAAAAAAAAALVSEADWLAQHPGPVTFTVQAPAAGEGADEFGCAGQRVELELPQGLATTAGDVKTLIEGLLGGFPAKKMKVSSNGVYLNKDASSLAAYNFAPGATLVVGAKTRGGRK